MTISQTLSILDCQLLYQLGDRLQRLRKAKGMGTVALAEQVGISRPTLRAVESGDPNTSIGTYLRVMSALGIGGEMAMLASDALNPSLANTAAARSRRSSVAVQVTISADRNASDVQDLQSLALHAAAVRMLKDDDLLRQRARATLHNWLERSPDSRTALLWRDWDLMLEKRSYRAALGRSARAQQLRQASPLPTVLPQALRRALLEQASQLKRGLVLNGESNQGGV